MASSLENPAGDFPESNETLAEGNAPFTSESNLYGAIELEFPNNNFKAQNTKETEKSFGFDIKFLKRFYRIHKLLFKSLFSVSSALFIFLIGWVVLQEYVVYHVGMIAGDYYMALGNKDIDHFWRQTRKAVGLILAVTFINATTDYMARILSATFRQQLCETVHRIYFSDIRYYQVNVLDKELDNPDQRMTQDISTFCTTYCETLPKILVSPFTIAYYCYQGYQRSGWPGPVGCFVFFIIATTINKLLMGPIVNYVVKQEKREGDFRFLHMLVRVNAEPLAFHDGAVVEHQKVNESLTVLVDTQRSLYLRQYFLSLAVNFFNYIGSIFTYLLLAIRIFSGEYNNLDPVELSTLISNNAFILIYLIYSFTRLIEQSTKFTDVAGVTHRISRLLERLKELEGKWTKRRSSQNDNPRASMLVRWADRRNFVAQNICRERDNVSSDKLPQNENDGILQNHENPPLPIWTLENFTLTRPEDEEPLIKDLDYQFVVGQSVIITGASAAGKTSLFRALCGIWRHFEGRLKCHFPPGPCGVYFSPQKAYLTWGTLREQISFPLKPDKSKVDDNLIIYYITQLKLKSVLDRAGGLDQACSWTVFDSLSPGEMQRLCILRIFFHRPVVAVLDEGTSALPLDMEEFVYSELKRVGITLISVGHRQSIRQYHDKQLIIHVKGKWEVLDI